MPKFVNIALMSALCLSLSIEYAAAAPAQIEPANTASDHSTAKAKTGHRRAAKKLADTSPPTLEYLPIQPLTVVLGEIKLLPMPSKVSRVALGSGSVVSTTTVEDNLLLIAEQVGETTLMVWSGRTVHTFRVQVISKDLASLREKIEVLTGGYPGIIIKQVGPDLVLSGLVHKEGLQKLTAALNGTPNIVLNLSEDQGSPFTRSVLFRLHFVEVKRALLEQIGINWAKEINGPVAGAIGVAANSGIYGGIPQAKENDNLLAPIPPFVRRGSSTGGVFLGLATTLTSRINLGISDGDARVLASPELTAKSGGKAKLQVGGEVPIPLTGAFGATTVEFKPYGIMFSIEPLIDSNNIITAKVSTELSQIDPAVSVQGIPGFITRNTSTDVSVKPGEIVALSGLINSELSNSIDRVPGISALPILGRLFRSDDFRNRRTELVVFIETEIISAGDGLEGQLRARGLAAKKEIEARLLTSEQERKPITVSPHDPF